MCTLKLVEILFLPFFFISNDIDIFIIHRHPVAISVTVFTISASCPIYKTSIRVTLTNEDLIMEPEWGFEPTLWLLTENVDYEATALPSELSSSDLLRRLPYSHSVCLLCWCFRPKLFVWRWKGWKIDQESWGITQFKNWKQSYR